MKKLKHFLFTLILALAFNGAFAQNDSIYGLEAKVENDSIKATFLSSYNISDLVWEYIAVYDKNTNTVIGNYSPGKPSYTGNDTLLDRAWTGGFYIVKQDSIEKFIILTPLQPQLKGKSLRIDIYLALKTSLKSNDSTFSNVLTYIYNPTTGIAQTEKPFFNLYTTVKYYNLLCQELSVMPYNEPYIEMYYNKDQVVYTRKIIRTK